MKRTNLLWGLVFVGVAAVIMLGALDLLPPGMHDLAARAWPVLLVFCGLSIFLRDRVRFGSMIALVVSAGLLAGITVTAYSTRITQQRDDNQQTIAQEIGAGVSLLRVRVNTLATQVELLPSLDQRQVSGTFTGSSESQVTVTYNELGDSTATLTVSETQSSQFPLLERVGRGSLTLELPPNVPLDVEFIGADGGAALNLGGLALERLNIDLLKGDAIVTLPEYDPQGSPEDATLGALAARDGALTVRVPAGVGARFELNRGASGLQPLYDATLYNLLVGDIMEARNIDTAPIKVRYTIIAPRGVITIEDVAS